jgi:radical SAM protein with 4Fe4S-binding SPASM domain
MGLRSYLRGTILLSHTVKHLRTVRQRRTHPHGHIPEAPSRVIVEPTNACNLKCTYCGNKDMARPWTYMPMDMYERVIAQMRELNIPRITLHTVGEPTLHPELPEMIRRAKAAGLTVTLSTNGTTLNEQLAGELVRAGPDILNVSADVVDGEKMKQIRPGVDPGAVLEGLGRLRRMRDAEGPMTPSPWGLVRLPSLVATCVVTRYWDREEERRYFETYGPLVDDIYIHWPNSHAGYVTDEPHRRRGLLPHGLRNWVYKRARYSCPYPWDALFLLSDGTISVCRFDFDARVRIGHFPEQSLAELWRGQAMMSLRKAHMDFDFRDWSTCENCNATFYENRHEHYRFSQKLKRRNGYVAERDMWLPQRPMGEPVKNGERAPVRSAP